MWRSLTQKLTAIFLLMFCGMAVAATSVCTLNYSTRNDWPTGFVVDIVITNTGTAPVSNWKVDWRYDTAVSLVSSPWRASVKVDGGAVSATDNGANPTIGVGGKVSFGMALSYTGGIKPEPKNLSVTGNDCVVAEVFYVDPNSNAAIWVRNNSSDPHMPAIRDNIARQPAGKWFGNWSGDITKAVGNYVEAAAVLNQTPILVAYNILGRDCSQYSSGGANSVEDYKEWIGAFAAALGTRKAVIILEPDAIP